MAVIAENMVFNLAVGVQGVPCDDVSQPAYALLIADTVVVKPEQVSCKTKKKKKEKKERTLSHAG
jgi:hypothetical protein